MRISEISRAVRELYQQKSQVERLRREFVYLELDDDELELFAQYVGRLQGIGINLQDERLQDALSANPRNMEAAIQAVLEYSYDLQRKHQAFKDRYHATNCLAKALQEGWKPSREEI